MKPNTLSRLTTVVPTIDRSVDRPVDASRRVTLALACLAAAVVPVLVTTAGILALVTVTTAAHGLVGLLIGWSAAISLVAVLPTVVVRAIRWALAVVG